MKFSLTLNADSEVLIRVLDDGKAPADFTDGKVAGNDLEFTAKLKPPMGKIKTGVTGSVDGNKISGGFKTPMGTIPYAGERA